MLHRGQGKYWIFVSHCAPQSYTWFLGIDTCESPPPPPNDISISSAVVAGLTVVTNRHIQTTLCRDDCICAMQAMRANNSRQY